MIISAKDCWDTAKVQHSEYFDKVVLSGLKAHEKNLTVRVSKFLIDNHVDIRDGDEQILRCVQFNFDLLIATLAQATRFRVAKLIKKIYNYNAFSRKHPINWCAYKLCEHLSVLTCPYCNLAYGHTLTVDDEGVVRPTLDHFFDKATYPIFSISLGNLVASCYQCNSSLKGQKNFYAESHLNPLVSSEAIKITLDVDPIKCRFDLKEFDKANVKLEYDKNDPRALNSIKTFYLEERYQFLVDEARFIAKNMRKYKGIKEPDIGWVDWVTRGVNTGNYKNVVLGKLIIDLSNDFLN